MKARRCIEAVVLGTLLLLALPTAAQEEALEQAVPDSDTEAEAAAPDAGPPNDTLVGQQVTYNAESFHPPEGSEVREVLWDFGDGVRTTGTRVTHAYARPGSYLVTLRITTSEQTYTDTTGIRVFEHAIILVSDSSAPADQIELHRQRAAENNILLISLRAKSGGPEVVVEEELTEQLVGIRPQLAHAHSIIMWTSGGVGANVLTRFAQHLRTTNNPDIALADKGIILLSETPFALLQPTAQSAFDQLLPSYVLLARPQVLDVVLTAASTAEARDAVLTSPLDYRLLGTFSARTVADIGPTNFMSFGINFLVNRGVPINSIVLILMLPIIATLLAFARQVIGIKAFGLLTPAMTAVSFLVMGLSTGLIVFLTILVAGTLTRLLLRRLRLLYLPRMALVLTSVSFALLVLLAVGALSGNEQTSSISFSIFPALILTILAEDFIAAQFKSGFRTALTVTAWTVVLACVCYLIVSSEIFRTLVLSYPEITLLAIPLNVILGRWSGLRLTEYFRFRELLRHDNAAP